MCAFFIILKQANQTKVEVVEVITSDCMSINANRYPV